MSEVSECEDEAPNTQDLDYDMWEGQFEFVGPSNNAILHPDLKIITPSPHLSSHTNGARKSQAHAWCEDLTDNVNINKNHILHCLS